MKKEIIITYDPDTGDVEMTASHLMNLLEMIGILEINKVGIINGFINKTVVEGEKIKRQKSKKLNP